MTATTVRGAPLTLERRDQPDYTTTVTDTATGGKVIMGPRNVGEDYWTYRVRLSDHQAVVGFPKIGTVGIGFAQEDASWNCNLPYRCHTDEIFRHILRNKGDAAISNEAVMSAIRMVQEAALADRPEDAEHGGIGSLPRMSELLGPEYDVLADDAALDTDAEELIERERARTQIESVDGDRPDTGEEY